MDYRDETPFALGEAESTVRRAGLKRFGSSLYDGV